MYGVAWVCRGVIALLALSCAACDLVKAAGAGPEGNSFVIANVRLFDGQHVLEGANVVVVAGRIAEVAVGARRDGLPLIDGSGQTLLPGLVDAHAHVMKEDHLRNALRFGVTTQLDMFTRASIMQAFRGRRDKLDHTDLSDMFSAGVPVTSAGGMGTQFGIPFPTISGPSEAAAFVRARVAEGSDYIKILYEPSAGIVTTISKETLAAVIAAAHAERLIAVVHVSSLEGARDAISAGADGLAHLFGDAAIDDELLREMSARRTFVVPTLSIFAAIGGKPTGPSLVADPRLRPYLTEGQVKALTEGPPILEGPDADPMAPYLVRFKLDTAIENVRRLHRAGIRILAGDDVPNLASFGVSLHGELKLLTTAGLSPLEALVAATGAPAEAFGLRDRGRAVVGARADLVLVDGNPLVDIEVTRAIVRVFKNGFEIARPKTGCAGICERN